MCSDNTHARSHTQTLYLSLSFFFSLFLSLFLPLSLSRSLPLSLDHSLSLLPSLSLTHVLTHSLFFSPRHPAPRHIFPPHYPNQTPNHAISGEGGRRRRDIRSPFVRGRFPGEWGDGEHVWAMRRRRVGLGPRRARILWGGMRGPGSPGGNDAVVVWEDGRGVRVVEDRRLSEMPGGGM